MLLVNIVILLLTTKLSKLNWCVCACACMHVCVRARAGVSMCIWVLFC